MCGKALSKKSKPFKYISGHKREKPYQCSHCDMDFSNTSDLQMHLRTHIWVKPNQCSYCDKLFTKNSKFVRHLEATYWGKII